MLNCRAEGRFRHLAERHADSFVQSDSPPPNNLKEAGRGEGGSICEE
jgi:hypothetical protein